MGLSYTGSICLLDARVNGCSRVPRPPARMIPFMVSPLARMIVFGEPALILLLLPNASNPIRVGKIPGDSLPQALVQVVARLPAELAVDSLDIHGIAPVMPWAILHELDQALVGPILRLG